MTTPTEPTTADAMGTAERVPREQLGERIRNVDRDWSTQRERDRSANGPSRVLVPFDASEPACSALEYAFELFPDVDVTALLIVEDSTIAYIPDLSTGPYAGTERDLLEGVPTELERAIEIAESRDERLRTAGRVGPPTQGILEYLERESVDHVVIGSHCRSGLARVLRGSVAESVVRRSPVPVTVIRSGSEWGD
ncbi:universal stress protein [Natrinema amylolyticum]|uniref:universal stress protein n=1 Tax=Natrinema amylolyticum TaxID=2878679 RepID=UPI001CF9B635|nr:universal stress protein [Natrinema amylolyticum]